MFLFFLSVLKDVPNIPIENYGLRERDSVRLSIFPNLNYSGLYQAILTIIDIVPIVQVGQPGKSISNSHKWFLWLEIGRLKGCSGVAYSFSPVSIIFLSLCFVFLNVLIVTLIGFIIHASLHWLKIDKAISTNS